jgi:hypothetical protein
MIGDAVGPSVMGPGEYPLLYKLSQAPRQQALATVGMIRPRLLDACRDVLGFGSCEFA